MEIIFELFGELLLEGACSLIYNKKIPLWIKVPLIIIISVFYLAIFIGLLLLSLLLLAKNEIIAGIIILAIDLVIGFQIIKFTLNYFQ